MKQHQIIALVKGKKARAMKLLTTVHHGWKAERISGVVRTYQPLHDDGERFPNESHVVQVRVDDELKNVRARLVDLYNIVAAQEYGNLSAIGDITVGDNVIAENVPVTVLLFLDKQLTEMRTLIANLPTLAPDKVWTFDEAKNCYATDPEKTVKTQKVTEPIVKYDATPEHPAQTELITKDRTIGHWTVIHLSGAIQETSRNLLLAKVEALQDSVKVAREQANNIEVQAIEKIGNTIIDYVFEN